MVHQVPEIGASEERVVLLAPFGQDAPMAAEILRRADIAAVVCTSMLDVCSAMSSGAGVLLIAYEALSNTAVDELAVMLDKQPAWSDIPIVVFMPATPSLVAKASQVTFDRLGNVTLMERPIRIATLVSGVRAALRARRRQYLVRTLMEQLRRSDQTKDAFLAAVSHELRTPLSAILGWTTLARQATEPTRRVAALDVIERNSHVLAQLVEDLLDLGRIAHGRFRMDTAMLNLADVVRAAVDAVRPSSETKHIRLDLEYDTDLPLVVGDAIRLQQVVWNLLWNAVKFTPERGRVSVHVRGERPHKGESSAKARAVELEVTDSGRGIAREILPHVFEPFRQGDRDQFRRNGGLGLGLAIVKHLVELHGGSVTAHSAGRECGATFRVRLPSADQRPARRDTPLLKCASGSEDAILAL
jgi:signal transduction histidine kinase